jgi:hypothetical protein
MIMRAKIAECKSEDTTRLVVATFSLNGLWLASIIIALLRYSFSKPLCGAGFST